MNHLDTFSGIGGWALAARWMGWQTLAFVEKEKFCHKVLNKNFPGVPIYDDIFTFSGKPFRGRVDVLTGSTPCQPFSQAGKREGSNDERHLFPEFLRVVAEVEPRWIIIENVYGLLSIESGQVFEDYHASLESQGYSVQTVCIPASALNAPHRRDRLWIVACTNTNIRQARSRNVAKSIGAKFAESCPNSTDTTHALNSEHRANRRPQSEADSIQGIGGAKGLSGRVGGAVTDVSDTASDGRSERCQATRGTLGGGEQGWMLESQGADSDVADATSERPRKARRLRRDESQERTSRVCEDVGNAQRFNAGEVGEVWQGAEPESGRGDSLPANPAGERLERGVRASVQGRGPRLAASLGRWQERWSDVAARTCLRGMDDGVPVELDIIGSRDNRVSRLKSLGNAIVPSIAYELFKAIEEADQ